MNKEKQYKCLKCGEILKHEDVDFGSVGIGDSFGTPIGTEFKDTHKDCGGEVFTKEEMIVKNDCEKLYNKHQEFKKMIKDTQDGAHGQQLRPKNVSSQDIKEYHELKEKLKNKCKRFLTPEQQFELED